MAKAPEWLKHNDDGSVDITLSRPLTINGASIAVMRMREPTVNDQLAMDAAGGGDATKELTMMANLTEQDMADLKRLPLRDYKRLQTAFVGFID